MPEEEREGRESVNLLPPGRLQVERMPDGRRRLLRDLNLQIEAQDLTIPEDFDTDYSSWPRFVPGPSFKRIDIAGLVHDALFRWGTWGVGGRPVTYSEANRMWFLVARAGDHPGARASWFWAWVGRIGLFLGSWPVWLKYRSQDVRR